MQPQAYPATTTGSPTPEDEPIPGEVFTVKEQVHRAVEWRRLTGRPPITLDQARRRIGAERRWQCRNLARQTARAGLGATARRTCGRLRGRSHRIIARARSSVAADDDGEPAGPWWRRWFDAWSRP